MGKLHLPMSLTVRLVRSRGGGNSETAHAPEPNDSPSASDLFGRRTLFFLLDASVATISIGGDHLDAKITNNPLQQAKPLRHVRDHLVVTRPIPQWFSVGGEVSGTIHHAEPQVMDLPRWESVVNDRKLRADGNHCSV